MAPRKRPRDIDDDGSDIDIDIDIDIEEASSSLRHSLPKRSRLSMARENGGSVVSDDDDEDDLSVQNFNAMHADGSEQEDVDEDDLAATQAVRKEYRELKENMASDQGVIEEVYCRNFMCHAKLRIKLGPLINFIIGHNGSGKSAVLTALTMCLGGKAKATNRGKKLSDYIKEGEDSATVAVKVKNQGDGAYKPDIYGRSITVERHFTRGGASSFKLKNESDKVISTKKGDLDDILDFFAFQLDNPINVLTQDMARQFLSNSSAHDKYKFFIKGTQLETLDGDYKLMEEHLDNIESRLFTRQQDIAVLKQKMDDAEAKKRRLEHTASITEKIQKLQWQHAWLQVQEQEQLQEQYEQSVAAAMEHVNERTRAAEAVESAYEGHNQSFESKRNTVHELQGQLQPLTEAHDDKKENLDGIKQEQSDVLAQERDCKQQLRNATKTIERLEGEIDQERALLAGAEGEEHARRMANLEELKAEVDRKHEEQVEHGNGYVALESRKTESVKALQAHQRPMQQRKEAVDAAEHTLSRLQNNQGRQFAPYREKMEDLVRAVNRETRWTAKPVGPMGMHIHITKPEWTSPVEKMMGGSMESFIVTCKTDQELLTQVMNRVGCKPGILIGNPAPLDTTGKEPGEDVDTVLRILRIDNDLVRNSLIINQAVDQTVLISDRGEAERFMFSGGSQPPRNVKATIAMATQRGASIRYDYTGRGQERSSNVDAWRGAPRMKTDIQDQIRIAKEALNQATHDMELVRAEDRKLQEAKRSAENAIKTYEATARKLKVQFQRAEDAVDQQAALIENNRPQDGKLQELERQLAEVRDENQSHRDSFKDIINAKDALRTRETEASTAFEAARKEKLVAERAIEKAEAKMEQLANTRRKALLEKNEALQLIDSAKAEHGRLNAKLQTQKGQVASFIEMAEKISPRVPLEDGTTPQIVDRRIERLIQDRQRAEREAGGTREELVTAYQQARQIHLDAVSQLQGMVNFAKELKKALTYRHFRWHQFRKYISSRARITFMYLLSERSFRGRINISHSDKTLDIKVEPDLSKASDAGRATKTLSGGEKSFSTICLLLSIWEAMGSPIRCLDEFDVFMDSVNRATSMKMMVEAARRSVGRQFVLITPQSMGGVVGGEDVKIHRMTDPERGQTALPYTQTA